MQVEIIYQGGYVPDLGIVRGSDLAGWLVYRHPEGQWVTLADLAKHVDLFPPPPEAEQPDKEPDDAE